MTQGNWHILEQKLLIYSGLKKADQKNDEILTRMKSIQKKFKYELRRCKRLKDRKFADALAKAFHSDTSSKVFWQNIKKLEKVLYQLQLEVPQDPKKLQRCGKIISVTYLTLSETMNINSLFTTILLVKIII